MNLLLRNHTEKNLEAYKGQIYSCWEFTDCNIALCPAFGKKETNCWHIPKTKCTVQPLKASFFQKLPYCLECSYLDYRAEVYPQGRSVFLATQLQNYTFQALKRLYQKEESFIEILNRIPDGLFTTDDQFRITYFNPAAERITGFSAYDAVGMYCKDVFKNKACERSCALREAVTLGKDVLNREYEILNIYGQTIPIICSTSPFKDKSGNILGGLEIFKDVSQIKNLQRDIEYSENRFRRLFEDSHDMIFISTPDGKLIDLNTAGVKLLGYRSKSELLNIESVDRLYLRPEDRRILNDIMTSKGEIKDFETVLKRRDGAHIHVLISAKKTKDYKSGEVQYEGIIKDISKRKLIEESLRRRNLELSIINSIAVAMNHVMDINYILDVTLENVLKLFKLDSGAIFLLNNDRKNFQLASAKGIFKKFMNCNLELIFKDNLLYDSLFKEEILLPPSPAFPPFSVALASDEDQMLLTKCFLISFKAKGIGMFAFDSKSKGFFGKHEIYLMGSIGNFLGGAIENVRLLRDIKVQQEQLRHLTKKLFQTQEEERRRIARELHDEAGQSLTAINLALEGLGRLIPEHEKEIFDEIYEIRRMLQRASAEIRNLSYRLHPTLLTDLGLEPALRSYFRQVSERTGIRISFRMVGFTERLDRELETTLYRLAQEALTNTIKHSGAENFSLSIIKSYPNIIFSAEDDGIGFDTESMEKNPNSLGLVGMRERVLLLGGTFVIRSQPMVGTKIRIEIPVRGG